MEYGRPTRLDTPLGRTTFNDFQNEGHLRLLGFEGFGSGALRTLIEPIPGRDGATIGPTRRGPRQWLLPGAVTLDDRAADAMRLRRVQADALNAALESILNTDGTLSWLPSGAWNRAGALTVSGNEIITDAIRLLNVSGDGRTYPDGSLGIWPAATNLLSNGGFETNTTGWAGAVGTETLTRILVDKMFGAAAMRVDLPAAASTQGAYYTGVTVAHPNTYTGSLWFKGAAGLGYTLQLTDGGGVNRGLTNFTATGAWQRVTVTAATQAGDVAFLLQIRRQSRAGAETFYIDGAQLELLPIATPYIHTDGATAARAAGRIQAPSSLLTTAQGWTFFRCRPGWDATAGPGNAYPSLFAWYDGAGAYFQLMFELSTRTWYLYTGAGNRNLGPYTFLPGSTQVVIGAWTPTQIKLSVNGSAFTTSPTAARANVVAALFDIGAAPSGAWGGGGSRFAGDILFAAFGTGVLTDADAAKLAAIAATRDPGPDEFPDAALLTAAITADDSTYRVAGWRRSTVRALDKIDWKGGVLKEFALPLVAPDPAVYADNQQTIDTANLAGGGSATIVNDGNAPSYPTIRIYGPVTNPTIRNVTTNQSVVFAYTLTAGHYLEIDMQAETVLYDGSVLTPLDSSWDKAQSVFWALARGFNTVTLSGTGGSGAEKATIIWRDRWA